MVRIFIISFYSYMKFLSSANVVLFPFYFVIFMMEDNRHIKMREITVSQQYEVTEGLLPQKTEKHEQEGNLRKLTWKKKKKQDD